MEVATLSQWLDEIDIAYYESGAYYDSDLEAFREKAISELEQTHLLSVIDG